MVIIYCCPSLGCSCEWTGQRNELLSHFQTDHVDLLLEGSEFQLELDADNDYAINYLMCYEEDIYLVQVLVSCGKAQVRLRYSGSEHAASSMRYSIQVQSGNLIQTASYSALKGHPGLVEIDGQLLKSTSLVCQIRLEGQLEVNKPRASELPEDCIDLDLTEQQPEEDENDKVIKKNAKGFLHRSISDISRLRSKRLNKKAIHKSDQSLFYSNDFFEEPDVAESLMDHLNTRINQLKHYQCHKCNLYIAGPIYQCSGHHSMCHSCLEESGACPCSMEICQEQRNPIIERMRDETRLPCRFEGCNMSVMGAHLQEHLVQCNHCVYICPFCKKLIGKYTEVEAHVRILHPSIKRFTTLKNPFPVGSDFLVIHAQGVFHCRCAMSGKSVDWKVEHFGHIRIYFESEVLIKSNKTTVPRVFKLLVTPNEKNVLKRSVSVTEVKPNKMRGAILHIQVYEPKNSAL